MKRDELKDKIIAKQNDIITMFHHVFDIDLGNDPIQQLISLESELAGLEKLLEGPQEYDKCPKCNGINIMWWFNHNTYICWDCLHEWKGTINPER